MKRIIRLTEQDLNKLVKRVINESDRLKSSIMKMLENYPINNHIDNINLNKIDKTITITLKDITSFESISDLSEIESDIKNNLGNVYDIEFDIKGGILNKFIKEMLIAYLEIALTLTADYYNENHYYDEDEEEEREDWDNFTIYDISQDSWSKAKIDCIKFLSKIPLTMIVNLDAGEIGSDFWLTRNGHGAGFWDRGYDDDVEKKLMDSVKQFGTQDLYLGNNNELHLS